MSQLTVRARLTLWNVLILAVLMVLLGLGVSWRIRSEMLVGVDRELRMRADNFFRFGFQSPPMMPGMPGPMPPTPGGPQQGQMPGPGAPQGGMQGQPGGGMPPNQPQGSPQEPRPGAQAPFGDQPRRGPGLAPQPGGGFGGQANGAPQAGPNMPPTAPGAGMDRREAMNPLRPKVFDDSGHSASGQPGDVPWDAAALQTALKGEEVFSIVALEGEVFRVYSRPLPPGGQGRVLQLARPMSDTYRALDGVNRTLLAFAPLAILIAAAIGYFVTRRALRPVGEIALAAERINAENLSGRLETRGADEFAQLGGTFNSMLERLEKAFRKLEQSIETQRRFTADASHELRSPLAAIKANTSLALSAERDAAQYKEALESIDKSATRMNALVQDLLTLARADAGRLALDKDSVDLREVLEGVVDSFKGKGPEITVQAVGQTATVLGSDMALTRLFENLLSNAVQHTPPDGKIRVAIESSPQGASVTIEDTGEGIAPEHLEKLGERFYRADASRSRAEGGVGLGLAICRSIVDAHGGTISFESELGKGTRVRVSFPR